MLNGYLPNLPGVISFRLFGSFARGDADSSSDLDVLVVISNKYLDQIIADTLSLQVELKFRLKPSISWYSSSRISEMFCAGHLFAWHLYLESTSLIAGTNDIIQQLGKPAHYEAAEEDIISLIDILNSVPVSLSKCSKNATYEAGIMFVCLRNIALSASWFSPLGLDFSRYSPFGLERHLSLKFTLSKCDYDLLISCRLSSQRGSFCEGLKADKALEIQSDAMIWALRVLAFVREVRHGNGYTADAFSPTN